MTDNRNCLGCGTTVSKDNVLQFCDKCTARMDAEMDAAVAKGPEPNPTLRRDMVLGSNMFGHPEIAYMTNPEARDRPTFIEINGEKVVCIAKGGECRYNHRYYTSGMRNEKSWTTPIIDATCPNECGKKALVCDDHPKDCKGVTYHLEHNKFSGQFVKYCRSFRKLEGDEDEVTSEITVHTGD